MKIKHIKKHNKFSPIVAPKAGFLGAPLTPLQCNGVRGENIYQYIMINRYIYISITRRHPL